MDRTLDELETPAAVVDVGRMEANLRRAAEYCRTHGLAWRPHAKTHKVPELAARQVQAGAMGVTVATPREAEVMAHAVDDVLLAYPPFGESRLERLMDVARSARLTVALDSAEALRGLADAAQAAGRRVGVLIELDAGMHRTGVQTPEDAVAIAREAAELRGVEYRGVMFYPGHVRQHVSQQDAAIRELAATVARFVDALEGAGLAPGVVSGGSTPTFHRSHEIAGITEVRPGTSIFNDRTTAEIGACAWDDVAYSVLATVVSTSVPGQAVVDAGSKALAREELRADGGGYGVLLDRPEVVVKSVSEEHGLLDLSATDWRPGLGERVRMVPNHVCASVNLQETLRGVRGDEVVSSWQVAGRGRSRTGPWTDEGGERPGTRTRSGMTAQGDESMEARVARLEATVEELRRQLAAAPPPASGHPGHPLPKRRVPAPRIAVNWDSQLWLNRLGIALVLLGIALLFRYSIEQGWLTPAVRVAFGGVAGALLLAAGARLDDRRGFGAVLSGGGIAAWYISGWAAFHLYGLVGYLAAFAGMMAITGLAFGMALRRGSPALAILGAAGGLGTPLILGVSYGTPRGFALYTSLVVAWLAAVYLRRGWRAVLWTATAGGWLLLFFYARNVPLAPQRGGADAWAVQAAAVFAWLALGALPLAQRVAGYRRVGHERHWKHAETAHWYALALVPPLAALVTSAQIWHPQPEAWGWWTLAVAAGYALAAWLVYRPDHRIARALAFTASLLLSLGCVAAFGGDALLVTLAGQAVALHWLAGRGGGPSLRWMAHKVFIAAAAWTLYRLVESGDTDASRVLADLAVVAAGFASSFLVRSRRSMLAYRYFAHAALLGWVWRQLAPLGGGQGFATIAWCAYGLGLMLVGVRRGWPLLEKTAVVTLLLVVAKLFLVDLAALHALFRVLLFLGFGSVFLFLSYWLQGWWKREHPQSLP